MDSLWAGKFGILTLVKAKGLVFTIPVQTCHDANQPPVQWMALQPWLTFRNRASYIWDGRTATLQMLHFVYIFFKQISVLSILNMLHTLRFSLQNAVYFIMLRFLFPVLFTFYVQGELKFKCKTQVPKG